MPTSDSTQPTTLESKSRQVLTFLIISFSVVGVLALSWVVVNTAESNNRLETVKLVFAAVLPLLASWVGTILAFYFSKDNFLAATQAVNKIALDVSGLERLRTISAKEKMRPLAAITYEQVQPQDDDKKKLTELLTKFASFERMLILDQNNVFRYLIYRSMADRYLASITLGGALPAGIASPRDLTLKHLVDSDPKLKNLFQNAVGFVSETATLADVKQVMDKIDKCTDVFVTAHGKREEPILGWITDNTISDNSKI